jgi:hypothetical protein
MKWDGIIFSSFPSERDTNKWCIDYSGVKQHTRDALPLVGRFTPLCPARSPLYFIHTSSSLFTADKAAAL